MSLSEIPQPTAEAMRAFAAFKGAKPPRRPWRPAQETERENQGAQAFAAFEVGLRKRLAEFGRGVLRNYKRDRDDGRFAGTVGPEPPNRCRGSTLFGSFSRSLYRSPGGPSLAPVDESLGLFDLTGARSALMLLCHCTPTDGARIFERLGGPVVELRVR